VWTEDQAQRWHRRLSDLTAGAPTFSEFQIEKRRIFTELIPRAPMPGIAELLELLARAGVPVAIASSSPARWVVPAVTQLGIVSQVRAIVTADDVARRKPAPDVYLEALRRLGAAAEHSVAIEDSAPGVAAAIAASLWTVAIPHWLTARHDLSGAHLQVSSARVLTLDRLDRLVNGERPMPAVC
jgi:HAD superfamily hydrolase (TIGR01509 family)